MSNEPVSIWTIGHSTRTIIEFIELLKVHDIGMVADVRRFPGSRRHPQFGREQLASSLEQQEISYLHFAELGGRRPVHPDSPNTAWRNASFRGYADYMTTESFRLAVERLLAVARTKRTVMMCAEALWWRCHRALIADYFKAAGHKVLHILGREKIENHPFTSAARIVKGKLSYSATATEKLPFAEQTAR